MVDSFTDLFDRKIDKLSKQLDEVTNTKSKYNKPQDDPRLWYPATDKSGNGAAIIRFLPEGKGEDVPFVRVFSHSFQGPTGLWYIENCLTTIGKTDPVAELNTQLWNTGTEANQDIARKQKRKLSFYANIYVIKDPANPENEGSVRLFRFGKKIMDKVNDKANPTYEDDPKVDVFDLMKGANFRMVIRTVDKWRNYDKSEFAPVAPLFVTKQGGNQSDKKKMAEVWAKEYPLQEFVGPDQFKSYDTLKTQLNRVLGLEANGTVDDVPFEIERGDTGDLVTESDDTAVVVDTEDDSMNFFDDLARND